MKKLVSILLAIAMILSLSISVLADEPETVTLTITGAAGHQYAIFQVFTGDVAFETEGNTTKKVLSNVKYGQSYGTQGEKVTDDNLNSYLSNPNLAGFLKNLVKNPVETTAVATTSTIEITGLTPGYYLIKDITDPLPDGHTESPVILQVLDNVTIASKHASIVSEKKVDDHNDSTNDENDANWQDVADYDIGDLVPFQLSITLPSTFASYDTTYELICHDKQAPGFDDPTNIHVYLQRVEENVIVEEEINSGYSLNTYDNGCGHADCDFGTDCSFTLSFANVHRIYEDLGKSFVDGDKLIVRYESRLNNNATEGRGGNINSMYVVHPDGHTPVDHVAVLTYRLTIHKVDKDGVDLNKAGFTLYKWVVSEQNVNGAWEKIGDEIGGKEYNDNDFAWRGLDGGTYKLEETTTPDGYNTMAPLEFLIDADHVTEWHGDMSMLRLRYVAAFSPDKAKVEFSDIDEHGAEDGLMEGNVVNYKGVVLPSTGAEGTFFLITVGTLLVLVAVVFMITRKKMSIYED